MFGQGQFLIVGGRPPVNVVAFYPGGCGVECYHLQISFCVEDPPAKVSHGLLLKEKVKG